MIFTFLHQELRGLAGSASILLVALAFVPGAAAATPAEALRAALDQYDPASANASRTAADAFFLFEDSALDRDVAIRDPSLYREIEGEWMRVIGAMRRGAPVEQVREPGERTLALLERARESAAAPGSVFVDSLLIILREGFEAILIVSALAAYLGRVGQAANLPYLYGGAALAVAASVGLWAAARTFLEISGVGREALEGWTMLLATAVLFWVSYWLISKAEASRWQAFVRTRVEEALGRGALLGFGFLSFVVVFREGFETVLFYEALAARAGDASGQSLLLAGFVTGVVLLGVLYALFLRLGPRVPLRAFFSVTGALLYFLAFKFAGAGIFELQVAQALSQTPVDRFPDSLLLRDWFGIYPYAEPLALQGLLVALALVAAIHTWRRGTPEAATDEAAVLTGAAPNESRRIA